MQRFDGVVLGAGAAGMFCAGAAAARGLRVALVDHAPRLGEKIRISGGGRCNFTNLEADRTERFVSDDPDFARTALQAYRPAAFLRRVESHGIGWHEKHRGQLFCDDSSERIVEMLRRECDRGGVRWFRPCAVRSVTAGEPGPPGPPGAGAHRHVPRFTVQTDAGALGAAALVVATGGLSIPKIGATDLGYRLARQFGLGVVEPRPALVPLTFTSDAWRPFAGLAGLGLEVDIRVPGRPGAPSFREDMLFTHRGLSGPAILQASTYWRPGDELAIDLAPGRQIAQELIARREGAREQLDTALAGVVPRRLAQTWLTAQSPPGPGRAPAPAPGARLSEIGNGALHALAQRLHDWRIRPAGSEGWRKAEVTAGGVATAELDPATLQARRVPGLYFIGEVVDVTGWLGGYNFQWAWASAWAAAQALAAGR